jgi:hypothetical protein
LSPAATNTTTIGISYKELIQEPLQKSAEDAGRDARFEHDSSAGRLIRDFTSERAVDQPLVLK